MSVSEEIDILVRLALENTIILSKIFKLLPFEQLKKARLVSQFWNLEGILVLGRRGRLQTYFIPGENVILKMSLIYANQTINPALYRSHRVVYTHLEHPDRLICTKEGKTATLLYQDLIDKLKDTVEILQFRVTAAFSNILRDSFEDNKFLRLHEIIICEDYGSHTFLARDIAAPNSGGSFPNLKILKYKSKQFGIVFQGLVQWLISNAPELRKLQILDNFFPDMSKNKNLCVMKWSGFQFKHANADNDNWDGNHIDGFSMSKLSRMLSQIKSVSKNLVELSLGGSQIKNMHEFPTPHLGNLTLPHFEKLTTLKIQNMDAFADTMRIVSHSEFPQLKNLSIRNQYTQDTQNLQWTQNFLSSDKPFASVETFKADVSYVSGGVVQPVLYFANFLHKLPNLKCLLVKLKAGIPTRTNLHDEHMKLMLLNIAKTFPDLKQLEIQPSRVWPLSNLMRNIAINNFNDLKSLTIRVKRPYYNREFGECNNFHRSFLAYKSMTLEGFLFTGRTLTCMKEFIKQNNLDVRLV